MKCINTILATSAIFTAISFAQEADPTNTANAVSSASASESGETALPTTANDAGPPGYTTASTGTTSTSESDGLPTHEPVPINTDGSQASTGHTAHPTTGTTHAETGETTHEPLPTTLGNPGSTGHTAHSTIAHTHPEAGATTHGPHHHFGPRPSGDGMKVMIDGTLYVPATICGGNTDYPPSEEPGSGGWAPPPYGEQPSDAVIHPTGGVASSCSGDKHRPTRDGYTGMTTLHTRTSASATETGGHARPTNMGSPSGDDEGEKGTTGPAPSADGNVQVQFPSTLAKDRKFAIPTTNVSTPIFSDSDGVWAKKMVVLPYSSAKRGEEAADSIEDGEAQVREKVECAAFSDKEGDMAVGEAVRAGETGRLMGEGGDRGGGAETANGVEGADEERGMKVRAVRCWQGGKEE